MCQISVRARARVFVSAVVDCASQASQELWRGLSHWSLTVIMTMLWSGGRWWWGRWQKETRWSAALIFLEVFESFAVLTNSRFLCSKACLPGPRVYLRETSLTASSNRLMALAISQVLSPGRSDGQLSHRDPWKNLLEGGKLPDELLKGSSVLEPVLQAVQRR